MAWLLGWFDVSRLVVALLLVSFFAVSLLQRTDPDYWWHLRTGQWMIEKHAIPRADPFSYTAGGKHWVAHEWLSELIIYGLQEAGGYTANVLVFSFVALAALVVAYLVASSFGLSRWLLVLFLVWAGVMSLPFWTVRPQVFTWFLLSLFLWIVFAHRRGQNRLWLLPPLMVLWANLHLGFAFGLAVVGLYTFATLLERYRGEDRDVKWPLIALSGCLLATLLTPYPGELLLYPITYARGGSVGLTFIAEWKSPNFHALFELLLAAALLTLMARGVFRRRGDLFIPGLALCFSFLALQANRNLPLFALVFLILAGVLFGDEVAQFGKAPRRPYSTLNVLRNVATLLLAVVLVCIFVPRSSAFQLHRRASVSNGTDVLFPVAGAEFIKSNYPDARMFNFYDWGGYLIYELQPRTRVFVDGRSDMYENGILDQYLRVSTLDESWRDVLREHDVDLVIMPSKSALSQLLDVSPQEWRRVFKGPIESVFVRNKN